MTRVSRGHALPWICLAALLSVLLAFLTLGRFADPDMFHELALFRVALALGHVPTEDLFSYTPTVRPLVHHELLMGAILQGTLAAAGGSGLVALRYLLVTGVFALLLATALRRGAQWPTLVLAAPVGLFLLSLGCGTVRAQLFTLLLTALLLYLLDRDREGGPRGWVFAWLPVHVFWVNVHAGFVVGLGLFGLHLVEETLRRRRAPRHLVAGLGLMVPATLLNPYGFEYVRYLARGLFHPRPVVSEWEPVWTNGLFGLLFAATVLVLAYALWRVGPRRISGLLIVLVTGWMAFRHIRHLSLWALVWFAYVLPARPPTPLGESLRRRFYQRPSLTAVIVGLPAALCLVFALSTQPWRLFFPVAPPDLRDSVFLYPVGAVAYLQEQRFRGNVMTPFESGAYVSWRLYPDVKVSMDGRYEVAYQPGVVEEQILFYEAAPGWQALLTRYPTDLVLVPRYKPVVKSMPTVPGWTLVYLDQTHAIYARPGLSLPGVDRSRTELRQFAPASQDLVPAPAPIPHATRTRVQSRPAQLEAHQRDLRTSFA